MHVARKRSLITGVKLDINEAVPMLPGQVGDELGVFIVQVDSCHGPHRHLGSERHRNRGHYEIKIHFEAIVYLQSVKSLIVREKVTINATRHIQRCYQTF